MPASSVKYILCKILVSDSLLRKDFFTQTVFISVLQYIIRLSNSLIKPNKFSSTLANERIIKILNSKKNSFLKYCYTV